ncbi:hypothetical protein VE02_05753 [Pseudogymnoascus sp. 03VT05]|nr:hypothetical protein VE02_05753 [Pseudogymnoascus sp. 03VT05]
MPTLLDLPVEVLEVIVSKVHSIKDIEALAVQCQRLMDYAIECNLRKATKLLLSILRKPILGTYVRDLEFCYNISEAEHNLDENDSLEEEEEEDDDDDAARGQNSGIFHSPIFIPNILNPSWENGGLYYPRCDQAVDGSGNSTLMEPYTGNAAIGYARLNIEDGQKKMWEKPWTGEFVRRKPFVDTTAFEDGGVDFLRAGWSEELNAFIVTAKTWHGKSSR